MIGIDAVLQEFDDGTYDIQIGPDGDILTEDQLDTYIIVALLTDKRAENSNELPPERRRGWVGNEHTPGFEMGSTVWQWTEQKRQTRETANGLRDAAVSALRAMVDEGLAVSIPKAETRSVGQSTELEIAIQRSDSQIDRRYFTFWQNTGVK